MGTPFWSGIESFWHKIQESLPETVWNHYEKYRSVLHVLGTPAKTYEKQRGILKTVNRSILEHRVVEIDGAQLDGTKLGGARPNRPELDRSELGCCGIDGPELDCAQLDRT